MFLVEMLALCLQELPSPESGKPSGDLPAVFEAAKGLLDAMIGAFGPVGALVVLAVVSLAAFAWRVYNDRRKDREMDQVIAAHEKAVQRAAAEAREYRAAFFKEKLGWSDNLVESILVRNQFNDAPHARKEMEGGASKRPPKGNRRKGKL